MLAGLSLAGAAAAYAFPKPVGMWTAAVPVLALSLMAGLSALWSP